MHSPGIGIKDFVSDVGHIVQNRSGRSRRGRRKITRRKTSVASDIGMGSIPSQSDYAGLYHQPGTASVVSSQFDGLGGPGDGDPDRGSYDDDSEDDFHHLSIDESKERSHQTSGLPAPNRKSTAGSTVRFSDVHDASTNPVKGSKDNGIYSDSLSSKESVYDGRERTMSDGTAGNKADDELDSDLELL